MIPPPPPCSESCRKPCHSRSARSKNSSAFSSPSDPNKDRPDERVDLDGNTIEKGERQANPLDEPAQWSLTAQDTDEPAIEGIEVTEAGALTITNPNASRTCGCGQSFS